ncbi:MAG: flagellar basal-body MS-ring/collar protein FliF, partial [Alphaproteobacteria bacterium]|nr:flagellar basal-body MS-ring/collar protein FliF [Alphaproteobacteria bacterium]
MDNITQALRNLGPMRLAVLGGVGVALIAFFIFLTARLAAPPMALLYGDLDLGDSSRIVAQLESTKTPYELRNGGTQVYVAEDTVFRLRMSMADQGLPNGGTIGYEIFDNADSLGTTNFVQNINLVRALEGELSRTIRTLGSVRSARVHLVMPKRRLFSREAQKPSASVILRMRGAGRLDKSQVMAIQHLVAAAVPSLVPSRISIVDDKGTLLARGFDDDGPGALAAKAEERRRTYEGRLARTIEELLGKTVGFGKVRAEVSANMDFDRISISEERFDPDGQVVRSTQSTEETSSSKDAEGNLPVSVAGNLPDPNLSGGDNASRSTSESRIEETVNFEISKKVINHVRESGIVNRLSVAVLVDGSRKLGADGNLTYQPRSEAEMELLATLVRSAIGFSADRGDTVEVINMEFADVDDTLEQPLELFFGLEKNDLLRMAEILVLSIVAILVILLVVRPLVTRAFEAIPSAVPAGCAKLLTDQASATPALSGPSSAAVQAPGESAPAEEEHFEELIDIDQ